MQEEEVATNKIFLEAALHKKINGYGYAHGSYNNASIKILQHQDFSYACTTEEAAVTNNSSAFCLPRLQVKNWNEELFIKNIEKLLNP